MYGYGYQNFRGRWGGIGCMDGAEGRMGIYEATDIWFMIYERRDDGCRWERRRAGKGEGVRGRWKGEGGVVGRRTREKK